MTQSRGLLFVLVGPGGTGKNTLMTHILDKFESITQLATATTRAMRPGEKHGRERLFVSLERFREMIQNGELLEYQEVTPNKFYGIPKAPVDEALGTGKNLIADVEVHGARDLRKAYGSDDIVLIHITVPGKTFEDKLEVLRQRMLTRLDREPTADDLQLIEDRLNRARDLEIPFGEKCDHTIINDDLDQAIIELDIYINQRIAARETQATGESS